MISTGLVPVVSQLTKPLEPDVANPQSHQGALPLTRNSPQETSLHVGGVVAMGFSRDGNYLLVVSHSGRGVYSTADWQRVARDKELSYPENAEAIGIGPIQGERIPVKELDYDTGQLRLRTPDGRILLDYESGTIDISLVTPES